MYVDVSYDDDDDDDWWGLQRGEGGGVHSWFWIKRTRGLGLATCASIICT